MKELKAFQNNPQYGPMTVFVRIKGQIIFLKSSNAAQKNSMVEKLRTGGAIIEEGKSGWLKIDMFANNPVAIMGGEQIDTEEMTQDEIEEVLARYYKMQYTKAKFIVTVDEVEL